MVIWVARGPGLTLGVLLTAGHLAFVTGSLSAASTYFGHVEMILKLKAAVLGNHRGSSQHGTRHVL